MHLTDSRRRGRSRATRSPSPASRVSARQSRQRPRRVARRRPALAPARTSRASALRAQAACCVERGVTTLAPRLKFVCSPFAAASFASSTVRRVTTARPEATRQPIEENRSPSLVTIVRSGLRERDLEARLPIVGDEGARKERVEHARDVLGRVTASSHGVTQRARTRRCGERDDLGLADRQDEARSRPRDEAPPVRRARSDARRRPWRSPTRPRRTRPLARSHRRSR